MELCGVSLRGPILNGSGTFDAIAARRAFGDVLLERFPFDAFVSKTITLAQRQGNPPPRLWETPAGLINSIGLPNKGLEGFLAEDLPQLAELPVPLVVSVMGFSRDELATLVAAVGERPEVAMIELNVSCPNVETGLVMGADPVETARAVERVRPGCELPLIVKLTPNASEPEAVAAAAQEAGADAVSLINTLKGLAFDPVDGRPWLGGKTGGVSGPAVRAIALQPRASRSRWSAWAEFRAAATCSISSARGPRPSRSAPRASETRRQGVGSPPSSPSSRLSRVRIADLPQLPRPA
jgi:dihydroorotate dehydrogenase (NAD+) catalytic subunit